MSPTQPDSLEVLNRLDPWLTELRERALRTETELNELKTVLATSRAERLDLPIDPLLVIMLCGATGVGKSTLINTLAGREISLPGLGATTGAAVLYVHEGDDPERLFEYGAQIGQLAQRAQTVVRHQRQELLHKVLIDTPDIDSVIREHRELTRAMVQAADLVLFVTTPERYKDMVAAEWVREQSSQRAMAFVLNKWDRSSIGLQWDRRQAINDDFHRVLERSGFDVSLVFRVSCLTITMDNGYGQDQLENRLSDLREYLEQRLDRSASVAIQERRRVMAWGRLAAVIASNIPVRVESEAVVVAAFETLASARREAHRLTPSMVAQATVDLGDQSLWPTMPGLFGNYVKFLTWCSSASVRVRNWNSPLNLANTTAAAERSAGMGEPLWSVSAFSRPASQLVDDTIRKLCARARGLPLKPVEVEWNDVSAQLTVRLGLLPSLTWSELLDNITKPSFRRFFGIGALFCVEAAIVAVLGTALWRIAYGFMVREYVTISLLYSAAAFVVILLLSGHVLANLFFPPLRHRFATQLARGVDATIDATFDNMDAALRAHIAAIDRLASQGQEMQRAIDEIVRSLRRGDDSAAVTKLFRRQDPKPASLAVETAAVRPKFE